MNKKQLDAILGNLVSAVHMLEAHPEFTALIPEVRVNLVYAPLDARTPQEVAAVDGRITSVRGIPYAPGLPAFGASDHMARLVLEVRKYDAAVNAGINFKCDKQIIRVVEEYCKDKGFTTGTIDRTKEPAKVAERDGTSMPWKMKYLVDTYGKIPRLFYEGDGWGKEPLYVAIGKDAVEVTEIAVEIAERCAADKKK
ncbi:MAG: thiamine-phosphate synthase family protein [Dehalococcoidales bacterium]|nr:thiamine-phosphate synthase family protein [Dehalococcoidales bacterium]